MNGRLLIIAVLIWILSILFTYYHFDLFIIPILLATFIGFIIQVFKLIRERKNVTRLRLLKTITFLALFYFTFFFNIPYAIIEKIDWYVLYNKRMEIVSQIENNKLKPVAENEPTKYKLHFDFPVISNGGNELIVQKEDNTPIAITFFISRNFFDVPSSFYTYTKNKQKKEYLEKYIREDPDHNWKVEENWYRISGHVSMALK